MPRPNRLGTHVEPGAAEGTPRYAQGRMLKFRHHAQREDNPRMIEALTELVGMKAWDLWPEDEPYGSLDAMCLDLVGMTSTALVRRLEARVQAIRDVFEQVTGVQPTADVLLRERIQEFAMSETANPWHRKCLTEMFDSWRTWNDLHFDNALTVPLILLAEPSAPNVLGSCGTVSAFGGTHQIRIRPSLLTGTHPMFERDNYAGVTRAGRFEFVRDVLLHEMIHQWQHETGRSEPSYSGHGPTFRDKCNEIGSKLAFPRVRTCKRRGKDADLPSCSQWPHNVRPSGYYQERQAA